MEKKIKTRIKIYLFKETFDGEFVKNSKNKFHYINSKDIFIKESNINIPRWAKGFLNLSSNEIDNYSITNKGVCCYFTRRINYNLKEYKFAISLGSADPYFDMNAFVVDFGIKICLNAGEKVVSINKNSIGSNMSKIKEVQNRKDSFDRFNFMPDVDLLYGITVSPEKNNVITSSNMNGSIGISINIEESIEDIDSILTKLISLYQSDKYKNKFSFIDDIKPIENDKILIENVHKKMIEYIKLKEFEKIWFGSPFFDEYENATGFVVENKVHTINVSDLDIDKITTDFIIDSYSDLKKITVTPIIDDYELAKVKLTNCVYGEIDIDNEQYIVNGENIYNVTKNYVEDINKRYNQIDIYETLPVQDEYSTEAKYNEFVCESNSQRFKLMDKNLYNEYKIEMSDIYDTDSKTFIHVKKYGASSVLSHLFLQANNAAESYLRDYSKIKQYYFEKYNIYLAKPSEVRIAMAIISSKCINGERVNIPFFSKISAVTIVERLKELYRYQVGLIFIRGNFKSI